MKIELFITCLNDAMFPDTGKAMVRLFRRLGHEVTFDSRQTCCGQMHFNSGHHDQALPLIRNWVEVFRDKDVIVSPSGSCVGMVRELFAKAAEWAADQKLLDEVNELSPRVFEFTEFLVKNQGIVDVGARFPHTATYHQTCHGMRVIEVGSAPIELLQNVRELTLVDLPDAEQCCGFGGTFSVKNADTSVAMMQDKCKAVAQTEAEYLIALDNSCLMHIGGGLSRNKAKTKPIHIAEVLASE